MAAWKTLSAACECVGRAVAGLRTRAHEPGRLIRRMILFTAAPFATHSTVYVTSRKPGLALGCIMADIAADFANAIEDDIGRAGRVLGHVGRGCGSTAHRQPAKSATSPAPPRSSPILSTAASNEKLVRSLHCLPGP
jgi:hypothetical protein